ncbi:hypothetical protein AD998_17175 [bacterium 336/3]|nr:hypothetical protein AD998_17175 [bacterium 336/3]
MKNTFWTLIIWFCLQNTMYAQNLFESQSRTGETQNIEVVIKDTINEIKKVDKVNKTVTLKATQEKAPKKLQLLQKIQSIKEATRIKKHLKTNRIEQTPLKSQKRADTIDTFTKIAWFSLGLAFFFLVRLNLQTLWLLVIGFGYLVLGSLIMWLIANQDTSQWSGIGYIIAWGILVVIPAFIVMFLAIFSYLALVWQAAVVFNIIGFSLLGLGLICLLIANLI